MSPEDIKAVRASGWDLERLRRRIVQLVIRYDGCGTSRRCFEVLHNRRGLSAHFLLDLDETIRLTLDLKKRAWQATVAHLRSIDIEFAHIGAFHPEATSTLVRWYVRESDGWIRIRPRERMTRPSSVPAAFCHGRRGIN